MFLFVSGAKVQPFLRAKREIFLFVSRIFPLLERSFVFFLYFCTPYNAYRGINKGETLTRVHNNININNKVHLMKKIFLAAIMMIAAATQSLHAETVVSDQMRAVRNDFQDRKFGIFLHWGIYSMLGDGEWVMHNKKLNREEYAHLAGGFCPSWFSAREWVLLFKEAGAQYVTFTSRHHDGFSMWNSAASDYNIVKATPFGRDVIKELSAACA